MYKKYRVPFSGSVVVEAGNEDEAIQTVNEAFEQLSYGTVDPLITEIDNISADGTVEEVVE